LMVIFGFSDPKNIGIHIHLDFIRKLKIRPLPGVVKGVLAGK